MEDPPPKLPWPAEEDVEVEEYTSPHEAKTISMRGDDAACLRISVVAPHHGSNGRAGRLAVALFAEVSGRDLLGEASSDVCIHALWVICAYPLRTDASYLREIVKDSEVFPS